MRHVIGIVIILMSHFWVGLANADDGGQGQLKMVHKIDGLLFQSPPVISPDGRLVFVEVWDEDDHDKRFHLFVDLPTGKIRCKISKRRFVRHNGLYFDKRNNVRFSDSKFTYTLDSQSCTSTREKTASAELAYDYRSPRIQQPGHPFDVRWNKARNSTRLKNMDVNSSVATIISKNGMETKIFKGHSKGLHQASVTPDDQMLVTAGFDNSIRTWNVQTGELDKVIEFKDGTPTQFRFLPDGQHILAFSDGIAVNDRLSYLINISTGKVLRKYDTTAKMKKSGREAFKLTGKNAGAGHMDIWFSPDGRRVFGQRSLKEIQVFDRKSGKLKEK